MQKGNVPPSFYSVFMTFVQIISAISDNYRCFNTLFVKL